MGRVGDQMKRKKESVAWEINTVRVFCVVMVMEMVMV